MDETILMLETLSKYLPPILPQHLPNIHLQSPVLLNDNIIQNSSDTTGISFHSL